MAYGTPMVAGFIYIPAKAKALSCEGGVGSCLSNVFQFARLLCPAYTSCLPCGHQQSFLDISIVPRHDAYVAQLPCSCRDVAVLLHASQSSLAYALHSQVPCSLRPILKNDSVCVCVCRGADTVQCHCR